MKNEDDVLTRTGEPDVDPSPQHASTVRFTPGPWAMEASAPEVGGWEIAPLDSDGNCDWEQEVCSVISTKADAYLIAAAPEMFGALKVIQEFCEAEGSPLARSIAKTCARVLAKAEGRS